MKHPEAQRRWKFSVTLGDEDEAEIVYLDANGEQVDEYDAEVFIGNQQEAFAESERRSNLFEDQCDDWVSESTYHSLGLVDASLYRQPEGAAGVN